MSAPVGQAALPGALRLPAQGVGRRRRAQPASPAGRHHPDRPASGSDAAEHHASACARATPRPADRRKIVSRPPDILITTPESLFLMLTSAARDVLRHVRDRDRRRGARAGRHQARRPPGPVPGAARRPRRRTGRVGGGLRANGDERPDPSSGSGCRRPCALRSGSLAYLGGPHPVTVVAPPAAKSWDLSVVVPVEDMSDLARRPRTPTLDLDDERCTATPGRRSGRTSRTRSST